MKFERLKALYDAEANVHYKGKLCEIIVSTITNKPHK